ncbi:MAG: hypothetical protein H8E13_04960 [Actinobacteria bacterium]|nr:hypothetical protein [Actinomycetota bacterium]
MSEIWLKAFLGDIGKYIVIFLNNYYFYIVIIIIAYGLFMAVSSFNLKRMEKKVYLEIINQSKEILKDNSHINYIDLVGSIKIDWEDIIRKYSFFSCITQESSLWVSRTSVFNVRETIIKNERKIRLILERKGIILKEKNSGIRENLYLDYIHRITKK